MHTVFNIIYRPFSDDSNLFVYKAYSKVPHWVPFLYCEGAFRKLDVLNIL